MYLVEKYKETIYREDCLYISAVTKLEEKHRDLIKQTYIKETKKAIKATPEWDYENIEEVFDEMFKGY